MKQLPLFEGAKVAKCALRITKAGDGLSEALDLDPKALHLGDEVSFVLTGVVTQVNHRTINGQVTRLHTVEVEAIVETEGAVAQVMIERATEALSVLRDQASGQTRIEENEPDGSFVDSPEPAEPEGRTFGHFDSSELPTEAELDAAGVRRPD